MLAYASKTNCLSLHPDEISTLIYGRCYSNQFSSSIKN